MRKLPSTSIALDCNPVKNVLCEHFNVKSTSGTI